MRIAVCDDERIILKQVVEKVRCILEKEGGDYRLDFFLSAKEMLAVFETNPYHIVILDIMMPGMDGFQLAEAIRSMGHDVSIIFISHGNSLVYQCFTYKPFWFLRKDEMDEMLPKALVSSIKEYKDKRTYIDIGDEISSPIRKDKLFFIECRGHNLLLHLENEILHRNGSLSGMEKKLIGSGFFRVHKSFMVNLDKVMCIEKDAVKLENGVSVALSKYKKAALKQKLLVEEP